jgi:hypothetical protein
MEDSMKEIMEGSVRRAWRRSMEERVEKARDGSYAPRAAPHPAQLRHHPGLLAARAGTASGRSVEEEESMEESWRRSMEELGGEHGGENGGDNGGKCQEGMLEEHGGAGGEGGGGSYVFPAPRRTLPRSAIAQRLSLPVLGRREDGARGGGGGGA